MASCCCSSTRDGLPLDWPEALNTYPKFPYEDCLLDKRIEQGEKYRDPKKPGLKNQDRLSYCLTDDNTVQTRVWTQVSEFCRHLNYAEVLNPTARRQRGKAAEELVRGAWVDEKLIGPSGVIRVTGGKDLEKPLTPSGLYQYLKKSTPSSPAKTKKYGIHGRRRLVYVRDLHEKPEYIVSLLFPASTLEVHALRSVLVPHILCEPSLSVTISDWGQDRFIMQFDLPCYRLHITGPEGRKETKYVQDISFLDLQPGKKTYMQRCQMSMVMSGNSFSNYTVYGLFSGVDEYSLEPPVSKSEEDDGGEDGDEEGGDEEDDGDEELYSGDHIAADKIDDSIDPTIEPRMYFLRRLQIRLVLCTSFWEAFGDKLDDAFKLHMNPRTPDGVPTHLQDQAEDPFDWAHRMTVLLDGVVITLELLCVQWEWFHEDGCDHYFTTKGMQKILLTVRGEFRKLNCVKQRLVRLQTECVTYHARLKGYQSLKRTESFKITGIVSNFTLKVLTPLIVTLGLFSMESSAIPFKQPTFINAVGVFFVLEALIFVGERISPFVTQNFNSMINTGFGGAVETKMSTRKETICDEEVNDNDDNDDDEDDDGLGRADTLVNRDADGITDVSPQV